VSDHDDDDDELENGPQSEMQQRWKRSVKNSTYEDAQRQQPAARRTAADALYFLIPLGDEP